MVMVFLCWSFANNNELKKNIFFYVIYKRVTVSYCILGTAHNAQYRLFCLMASVHWIRCYIIILFITLWRKFWFALKIINTHLEHLQNMPTLFILWSDTGLLDLSRHKELKMRGPLDAIDQIWTVCPSNHPSIHPSMFDAMYRMLTVCRQ
jgi:hypothetical protein